MRAVGKAIARRLSDERGFTLTELLITIVLMLVVLGATLTSLDTFNSNARLNTKQNDAQDRARTAIEHLARQLRNLAVPTTNASSIDFADRYDLIFKTADPTRRRVRYCLNTTAPAGTLLYQQLQASGAGDTAIAAADHNECPDADTGAWGTSTVVTDSIVNTRPGDRRLFSYACSTSPCPVIGPASTPTDLSKVTEIRTEIFLDINGATARPAESRIGTGVYLRNQNQKPVASWTSRRGVAPLSFVFNGSDSTDAENRTLTFFWFKGATPAERDGVLASTLSPALACAALPGKCIGTGVALTHAFSSTATADVTLVVRDPGGLTDTLTKNCDPTTLTGVCS